MQNDQLLEQAQQEFAILKKKLNLSVTYEELDAVFFISDYVLSSKMVSSRFGRMICQRISQTFGSWLQFIHDVLMPNPHNMISQAESQLFDDAQKAKLQECLFKISEITSRKSRLVLEETDELEKSIIEDSILLWTNYVKPTLIPYMQKINTYWKERQVDKLEKDQKTYL